MTKKRFIKITSYAILVIILIIGGLAIFKLYKQHKYNKLELAMTEAAEKYFVKELKGKALGINRHKITLQKLSDQNYEVDYLIKNCDEESYTYIKITNPNEAEIDKIEYTIENHLTCGKYQTNNKEM